MTKKTIIMGAAGRDFHNFNVYFRDNPFYEIVAFTATQIPNIENRVYPFCLSGELYPKGIPIYPETELASLIKKNNVELVVFSYSDVSHEYVMHKGALALSCGADYMLLSPKSTMIKSKKPVIGICAVRTGAGKSQTARKVVNILKNAGKKVIIIRHPMPYGDLAEQIVQRFETYEDLKGCTVEEREEYESHINNGTIVYAGVDCWEVLQEAEKEADIILWDGGNNDFPFCNTDLLIVVADPLRAGDELLYYPGEVCLRMADCVVINKINSAKESDIAKVKQNILAVNPEAEIILAESIIILDNPASIKNKKVLVVEDGPTITHGGMTYGAGFIAAERMGAKTIVDPRPYAKGSILEIYKKYPAIGTVLPAMGYTDEQLKSLEATINAVPCDLIISATPIDLGKLVTLNKESVNVKYELKELGKPNLEDVLGKWLKNYV